VISAVVDEQILTVCTSASETYAVLCYLVTVAKLGVRKPQLISVCEQMH